MTNFEKYKDEILEIIKLGHDIAVDKKNGKPCKCIDLSCENCKFSDTDNDCTYSNLIKWFCEEYYEEYKEPVKISIFTKMCLERLKNSGYNCLARDRDYKIWAYMKGAYKSESVERWVAHFDDGAQITVALDSFDFVKWEDEKPWSIQEILDNCIVEE